MSRHFFKSLPHEIRTPALYIYKIFIRSLSIKRALTYAKASLDIDRENRAIASNAKRRKGSRHYSDYSLEVLKEIYIKASIKILE